jgi:ribulose-5-phosphate 4-epimerase/fuculose-1-phosphate aldolase
VRTCRLPFHATRPGLTISAHGAVPAYGLSLYGSFDGPVLDGEEGRHIREAMGPHGKGVILQNHGILTASQSVDSVVVLFMRLEQLCETQLLVDAAGELCVRPWTRRLALTASCSPPTYVLYTSNGSEVHRTTPLTV